MSATAVSPADLRRMIGDGGELALVDVREELIFSRRHLLLARSIPLSRLELKFAQLLAKVEKAREPQEPLIRIL